MWAAIWILCFFVILTHYPVPDWETFTCPDPATSPNWIPFNFLTHFQIQYSRGGTLWGAIWDKTFLSMGMNFVICAMAGLALVATRVQIGVVMCIGTILPLLIETSQLTGVFGLAPCPYRQFDIDDIILNAAGVWCGAGVMWLRSRSADHRL
jgi:glycopeptide antibiotics resistance protein